MFDVGFWELVILFGLGLIVLGPERLPKVAAKVGRWAGQARNMARHLSSQLRDEIEPMQSSIESVRNSVESGMEGVRKDWSAKRPEPGQPAADSAETDTADNDPTSKTDQTAS